MVKIADLNEASLKAKEIIRNAFPLDKSNTKFVAPAKLERTSKGFKCTTITKIPGQKSRTKTVLCNLEPGFNGYFNACPSVTVDCSCARYLFVYNYALNQHDAAIKDRTNGEPPVVTNPENVAGCCKHGVLVLKMLSTMNPYWIASKAAANSGKPIRLTNLDQMLKKIRRNRV